MEQSATEILTEVQKSNPFTSSLTFQDYIDGLCKRYSRVYGEILNQNDHDTILSKLKEKGEL